MSNAENLPEDDAERILVVEDEPAVRELLSDFLTHKGYRVLTAGTGAEALAIAKAATVHLVLVDYLLPDLDGIELIIRLKKIKPRRPVVLMTGFGLDSDLFNAALKAGASGSMSKTMPLEELAAQIPRYLTEGPGGGKQHHQQAGEASTVAAAEVVEPLKLVALSDLRVAMGLMVECLRATHLNLASTAQRAMALARVMADELSLNEADRATLIGGAAFHDISLLGCKDELVFRCLEYCRNLSVKELPAMVWHPGKSAQLVRFSPEMESIAAIVQVHHEAWNGSGYPEGLKGEEIPWLGRLLAVIVTYCSQTILNERTFTRIRAASSELFDPEAVDALASAIMMCEVPRTIRLVPLEDSLAGAHLGADILDKAGNMLLPKGAELSMAWIRRVRNAHPETLPHVALDC